MATAKKVYKPMTLTEAEAYILRNTAIDEGELHDWDLETTYIYAEMLALHRRLDEIENQANEMMSPEKMMDMAQSFLGGSFK